MHYLFAIYGWQFAPFLSGPRSRPALALHHAQHFQTQMQHLNRISAFSLPSRGFFGSRCSLLASFMRFMRCQQRECISRMQDSQRGLSLERLLRCLHELNEVQIYYLLIDLFECTTGPSSDRAIRTRTAIDIAACVRVCVAADFCSSCLAVRTDTSTLALHTCS